MEEKREIIYSDISSASRKKPYDTMVYLDNGKVIAVDSTGNVIAKGTAGTDDTTVIQAALNAPNNQGTVLLSPGLFDVTDTIRVPDGCILSGSGWGTELKLNKVHSIAPGLPIVSVGVRATLERLKINGNAWRDKDIDTNGVQVQDYGIVKLCEIEDVRQYALNSYNACGVKYLYNLIHHTKYPFVFSGAGTDGAEFSNGCLAHGNTCYEYDFYVKIRRAKNIVVSGNTIITTCSIPDTSPSGIVCSGGDGPYWNISICNNTIIDTVGTTKSSGIATGADAGRLSHNISIANNVIDGFYRGISLGGAPPTVAINNIVRNARHEGIWIAGSGGVHVINNTLYNSGIVCSHASNCTIKSNIVQGGAGYWSAEGAGVYVMGGCDNITIEGNTITDCTGSGIRLSDYGSNVTNTRIVQNILRDNVAGSILDISTGPTTITNNIGYVTENSGAAATVADGGTIAHGCAAAPTKVSLTGSVAGELVTITSIDATNITVAIKKPDGSAGTTQTIYWRAEV
jgi:parallel beta-helix repeat protein